MIMAATRQVILLIATALSLAACSSIFPKVIVAEPAACECPDFSAPMSPTVLQLEQPRACPTIKPEEAKPAKGKQPTASSTDLLMTGLIEYVSVETLNLKLKAKLDTGAFFTSINALDLKKFERDGKMWARFAVLDPKTGEKIFFELPIIRTKVIKQLSGKYQERPVVLMTFELGNIKETVETTLSDRTGYLYQLLVGRNFTENRVVIDVGKRFMVK